MNKKNRMNKKGEVGIGLFVVAFMGIIVALAMFGPIADTTGDMTNIGTIENLTVTTAATNETITLPGREAITAITVQNSNGDFTANFTVITRNSGGALAILLKTLDTDGSEPIDNAEVNVSYSFKPQGYNDSSGARGIINIVLIFATITIMAFAYGPVREALANMGIGN